MSYIQDDYQNYIAMSRYARWIEEKGRRETWEETVERYVNHFDKHFSFYPKEEIKDAITNLKIMPSMRAMMTAGKALEKCSVPGYNCSYVVVDHPRAFDETLYILMCGTGVGFSVERQYIAKLPQVPEKLYDTDTVIVVDDSRIGWAKALKELISLLYAGQVPKWDVSKLRPAGARLKTFGGRSSGPEPLVDLFKFVVKTFRKSEGRKLNSIECHDIMCMIASIVVAGGVRRSALISLSNLSDDRMRNAKTGSWWEYESQRALANNSVAYTEKPEMSVFMREWLTLQESGSGERGMFNRNAAIKKAKENGRRDTANQEYGINPCQPGFATLLTKEGIRTFGDVEIGDQIWSESGWTRITNKWVTGTKPVYRYKTTAGYFLGTENHRVVSGGKKVEVSKADSLDLLAGPIESNDIDLQAVMDGLIIGDGSVHMRSGEKVYLTIGENDSDYFDDPISKYIIEPHAVKYGSAWKVHTTIDYSELERTFNRTVPERYFSGGAIQVASFLRGLYSANGSIVYNRVSLKAASYDIILQVQEMLSSLGIRSYYTTNKPSLVQHRNGEYLSKQSYDLQISSDREIFAKRIGFIQKYKTEKLNSVLESVSSKTSVKTHDIVNIEYIGEFEVFDITVDNEQHTYWTGGVNVSNCGEILLRPNQFCNLSEVVVRETDTLETLKEKVKLVTIVGTYQSMLTDFKYIRSIWKKNSEEERLLGVSLTGIDDHPVLGKDQNNMLGFSTREIGLEELKHVAIETNKEWSEKLGINQSVAVTTVKPSGTVSQLVDSSSGIHPRFSRYYIRRVRGDKKDPLSRLVKDSGIPTEDDVMNPNAYVFSFPKKSPESSVLVEDLSAIQQLEQYLVFRKHWCEHNPSITVYVKNDEWLEVGAWVYKHFDELGGVSFLPKTDHVYKQAPYEEITEEEYNTMLEKMPKIDWSKLPEYEIEDSVENTKELACMSGVCEI